MIKSSRLSKPCKGFSMLCWFAWVSARLKRNKYEQRMKEHQEASRAQQISEITGCQAHGQPIFLYTWRTHSWGVGDVGFQIHRFSDSLQNWWKKNPANLRITSHLIGPNSCLKMFLQIFVAKKLVSFHWLLSPHFHIPWFSTIFFVAKKSSKIWPEVWIQTRRASKEDQYPPRCFDESGRDRGTSDSCFYPLGVSDMPWQVWQLREKSSTCTF